MRYIQCEYERVLHLDSKCGHMAHVNCFVQFQNPTYTLRSKSLDTLNKCVFSVDFESVGAQIATIAHIHTELCDCINDLV